MKTNRRTHAFVRHDLHYMCNITSINSFMVFRGAINQHAITHSIKAISKILIRFSQWCSTSNQVNRSSNVKSSECVRRISFESSEAKLWGQNTKAREQKLIWLRTSPSLFSTLFHRFSFALTSSHFRSFASE